AGTTVRKVLEIAAQIRTRSQIPLLLFTYLNPVMRYGIEKLAADAKAAGIDGCLLTDASVEEAGAYVDVMRGAGLDTVFLAAPTSTRVPPCGTPSRTRRPVALDRSGGPSGKWKCPATSPSAKTKYSPMRCPATPALSRPKRAGASSSGSWTRCAWCKKRKWK